jgi:hypothetical protein
VTIGNIIGAVVFLSLPYYVLYYKVVAQKALKPKSEILAMSRQRIDPSWPPSAPPPLESVQVERDDDKDVEMGIVDKEKGQNEIVEESKAAKKHRSKHRSPKEES